ncbi:MAG: energy-coupling factor transporter transmembrane component T [Mycoplasma sp.]
MQISNSSINNNSIFRKLNPSFKLAMFVLTIIAVFVPSGFFSQILVVSMILIQFAMAKLSKKTYLNILKVFLTIFALFLLINWISIKMPMAVYTANNNFFGIGNWNNVDGLLWNGNGSSLYQDGTFISTIYGGEVIGQIPLNHLAWFSSGDGLATVDKWIKNIDPKLYADAIEKVGQYHGDMSPVEQRALLYLMNNQYVFDGIKYNVSIIQNIPGEWMARNLICNQMGALAYTSSFSALGPFGIIKAFHISVRVISIIILSSILTQTTTPSELTNGIEKLLSPLKVFKFPASECALILSVGIRFIPSLLSESKKILNAQASRGLDYNNGNVIDKVKSLISLIIPLFSISIKKSDELASAMDARSYNPRATRTQYRKLTICKYDYIYFAITLFILTFTIFSEFLNLVFMPFGIIEAALVL